MAWRPEAAASPRFELVTSLAGSASGPLPADGWRDIDDFGGLAAGQWRN